jgi:hypothetical protein
MAMFDVLQLGGALRQVAAILFATTMARLTLLALALALAAGRALRLMPTARLLEEEDEQALVDEEVRAVYGVFI